MMPEFITVKSSAVDAVGYDEEHRTLYVRFKCKNRYAEAPVIWRYFPLDRRDFEALLTGQSVGKFIHQLRSNPNIAQEKVPARECAA